MTALNHEPNPRIAVAIPCYNEAAAIGAVLDAWRAALPEAELVVFDNNSTDGTGAIARGRGARVVAVPEQGKGHAVRAAFAALADRDAVILVDGDGTYPAEAARSLLAPVLDGSADMTVGARRPVAGTRAMSPVRGLGNVLIRALFRVLIGRGPGDLLSGYRILGRRSLASVAPRARGFEIEAELASEAVAHRLRVVEVAVPYRPRIAGSASKLRALRDGLRIGAMILRQGLRLRPWRPILLGGLVLLIVARLAPGSSTRGVIYFLSSLLILAALILSGHARKWRRGEASRPGATGCEPQDDPAQRVLT